MPEPAEPGSLIRKILPFTSIAILIVAIYVGWIFYSRWNDNREADQARAEKQRAAAQHTLDLLGAGEFKILNFYAVPGAIKLGDTANICYGVSEATAVRIEPKVEELHPAISHCLQVSPRKTTEYTLTAEDGKGHTANQSFTIQVVR